MIQISFQDKHFPILSARRQCGARIRNAVPSTHTVLSFYRRRTDAGRPGTFRRPAKALVAFLHHTANLLLILVDTCSIDVARNPISKHVSRSRTLSQGDVTCLCAHIRHVDIPVRYGCGQAKGLASMSALSPTNFTAAEQEVYLSSLEKLFVHNGIKLSMYQQKISTSCPSHSSQRHLWLAACLPYKTGNERWLGSRSVLCCSFSCSFQSSHRLPTML